MHQEKATSLQMRGAVLVILAGCLWGTSGTTQAFAPEGATSTTIGAVRVFGSGIILLAIMLAVNARRFLAGPWPLGAVALAGFGLTAYQVAFFAAARMTGAGVAAILAIGSSPAIAGIMGYFFLQEKLNWRWALSTALAVFGGVLLVFGGMKGTGQVDIVGVLLALLAGFFYALEGVGIKLAGQVRSSSFETITAVFAMSALFATPMLIAGDVSWVFSLRGFLVALFLAAVSSALAFALFARGLLIIGVAKSYTLSLSEPLMAWLLSTFILDQTLAPLALVGVAVICGAILLLASSIGKESEDIQKSQEPSL